jgi:hypothetical protein
MVSLSLEVSKSYLIGSGLSVVHQSIVRYLLPYKKDKYSRWYWNHRYKTT